MYTSQAHKKLPLSSKTLTFSSLQAAVSAADLRRLNGSMTRWLDDSLLAGLPAACLAGWIVAGCLAGRPGWAGWLAGLADWPACWAGADV